jgi:hypothetical protein
MRTHHRAEDADACNYFQNQLNPYCEGQLNSNKTTALEQHLRECDHCQSLFQILTTLPDWETVAENSPPMPPNVQARIENSVLTALTNALARPESQSSLRTLKENLNQAIHRINLIFRPFQPNFAYRSEFPEEIQVIEHPGGELILETSLINVTIELTSIFEEFIRRNQTDESGQAHFKDLSKGDYLVHVEGYHLIEVKVVSPQPAATTTLK